MSVAMTEPKITGTFLDEITHDIPAQNWGHKEWLAEFDVMQSIGIDTVIIIRAGYKQSVIFPSKVIHAFLVNEDDLARLFLEAAAAREMKLFFGIYDSGLYWVNNDWQKEVAINKEFINEVLDRYGHYKSFYGWYLTHEVSHGEKNYIKLATAIGEYCKLQTPDKPTLISPYYHGEKINSHNSITVAEHEKIWGEIFSEISGVVDICAFQDGHVHYDELETWTQATRRIADEAGMKIWSNCESFDRDMPFKFPPIDWRKMKSKLLATYKYVEKIITFEFSHFMSPHSMWPSAGNLFKHYQEFIDHHTPA